MCWIQTAELMGTHPPLGRQPSRSSCWPCSPWPVITCQDCFEWSRAAKWEAWPKCGLPPAAFLLLTWSYDRDTMACPHPPHPPLNTRAFGQTHALPLHLLRSRWSANTGQIKRVSVSFGACVNSSSGELKSSRVCLCVLACTLTTHVSFSDTFQFSGSLPGASHCFGPQRMSSYCGFGAPTQLGEFMVSAKKRRGLSFCQSWFPLRFKGRPLEAAKAGHSSKLSVLRDFFSLNISVIRFPLPWMPLCC